MKIADRTLCRENNNFSFKEKIEIARQLDNLNVDVIELPEIENEKTDILLVRTVSAFAKNSVLSVAAGIGENSVENAVKALSAAKNARIRIELPLSAVGLEYTCHKKPPKMLEYIKSAISAAKSEISDVEFCVLDATRTEKSFLFDAIDAAVGAGATSVSVCDNAAETLPDEFASFAAEIIEKVSVPVGVACDDKHGMALSSSILGVIKGAEAVKTAVGGNEPELEIFAEMIKNCGDRYGFGSRIKFTELHRTVKQISWITDNTRNDKSPLSAAQPSDAAFILDVNDDCDAVISAVEKLGYDLSEEDKDAVFGEFLRVAAKKAVGAKELEAIVASVALQVPATYKLVNYIVNTGNVMSSSAQIVLEKEGVSLQGIGVGDGPIDAALLTVEQIIGRHFELDDFQVQAVTEGKEAMGSALVKLRHEGKLYSGNGISTDIIGASIRAYVSAVNKIVYEEA